MIHRVSPAGRVLRPACLDGRPWSIAREGPKCDEEFVVTSVFRLADCTDEGFVSHTKYIIETHFQILLTLYLCSRYPEYI
ncbi:hypothetical protein E6P09_16805 (plasmid) [Haloferax mediterranei ATCC 33500]|uniref:Uncharacterized protein n=1 Tax=Haloferax mediterranei (strain ATCC 33500 / DSM 1411 / JCM 8866 / NBRC 14739 / NCIMB 2177 / R-4) TaxID=523841 RepID=I3RAS7_HALMT|nr:hypothetical protein HFX_6215 [Haloferax mediterranei ATCC 33500]ELZ97336.1 hypothetical protein C439_18478 [Haloferax mediterranei ATCC 33500]QCQ76973.1 hypothetical protein E6P09_16805 [Haloferax mediterranei ATCC 33500]